MNKRIRKKKAKQQLIRAISGLMEAAEEMQREQECRTRQAGISYIKYTTCDRITYNDLCRGCTHSCKQSFRAVIILCPRYYSKRRKKEDRDNGR